MFDEQADLAHEIVDRWVENHKKSMTTFLILLALSAHPMWAGELHRWLERVAGWSLTERGLHRVLQRMTNLGLIAYSRAESPKSGADRKVYAMTDFGRTVAQDIKTAGLVYVKNTEITQLYEEL
ncbi:hypothetical protein CSA80_04060 [Candidatus Saccharibacteria bacterium]|nr:MAG: hypothetical protein CR973_00025 [Candidatus Saccharibacteria bacterium]PID98851.1 MAG: hypothetical protein CSA80_04060 [Candidatus Saccharibacteria bacterium]